MTRAEALAEARRRWGKRAYATVTRPWNNIVRSVGDETGNKGYSIDGTWEAAFADADRRSGVTK